MMENEKEALKVYFAQLNPEADPILRHAIQVEDSFRKAEHTIATYLERLIADNMKISFDEILVAIWKKDNGDIEKLAEEIEIARGLWDELLKEAEADPIFKQLSPERRISLKFGCKACKLTVSAGFISVGGLMGLLAAYSAGTAAPAYFVAVAAAVGVSVTTLYAILGAVVAGTISISDVPGEICKARGKC